MKSIERSTNALRRKELKNITRERKARATATLRDLAALRKQADKLIKHHRQSDAILARRAAIVQSRLS